MRLSDFITRDMEFILVQWEAFAAKQLPAAASMPSLALRDHAKQILEAVAADLRTPQTEDAQSAKSMGLAPRFNHTAATAAQTHALLRARSGFHIQQLAAEYRALRASVLRLWTVASRPQAPDLDDLIRFNEAIDQALAESIGSFDIEVTQARNLLLGMLAHDIRSPLQTIQMTASYLVNINASAQVSDAARRLVHSGARINALLDDLLDFGRTKLGLGINVAPAALDLRACLGAEVEAIRTAHPQSTIRFEASGDVTGRWDALRLKQLLGNVVTNALKYGSPGTPVQVFLRGGPTDVVFEVSNQGPAVDPHTLKSMFDPLTRGNQLQERHRQDGSLGLGLYIAREIARAHGGDITARSDSESTVFSVRLPRNLGAPHQD